MLVSGRGRVRRAGGAVGLTKVPWREASASSPVCCGNGLEGFLTGIDGLCSSDGSRLRLVDRSRSRFRGTGGLSLAASSAASRWAMASMEPAADTVRNGRGDSITGGGETFTDSGR